MFDTVSHRPPQSVCIPEFINSEECDRLIGLFDKGENRTSQATVVVPLYGPVTIPLLRQAMIVWLRHAEADELRAQIAKEIAAIYPALSSGQYSLTEVQMARYDVGGGHVWHRDNTARAVRGPRYSVVIQLSRPDAYIGGNLLLWEGGRRVAPRERGTAIFFPTTTRHRVSRLRAGSRYSAVCWIRSSAAGA